MAGVLTIALGQKQAEKDARIHHEDIAAFTVIGISARTNNLQEAGPNGIIPKQWQKLFQEGILARIPAKTGPELYAVYSDYESDHKGDYTYLIGAKVKEGTKAPAGMLAVKVQPGSYTVVPTDKGPVSQVVPAAWQRIFEMEDAGALHRAYKTDFEIYDQRAQNPQDAQVDIYLGEK
jgi:predicted transcriptional regulator YdeE